MAELARFFDSEAGDRIYSSDAWADILGTLQDDGYVLNLGSELAVTPSVPDAMSVVVGTGTAIIQGRYYKNTAPITLAVPPSDPVLNRIDRVVLRLDFTARTITAALKAGVAAAVAAAPALQRDAARWEFSLAQVNVAAGRVSIQAAHITDERADEALTGVSNGPARRVSSYQPSTSTADILTAALKADTFNRFSIRGDGQMAWGPGNAAADVTLRRGIANRLQVDGTFQVQSNNAGNVSMVVQQVLGQTANLLALRDSAAANLVTIDPTGSVAAQGTNHYFGANALGLAGTRLHVASTPATVQLLAEGSVANVDLYLQAKGSGQIVLLKPDGSTAATLNSAATYTVNGRVQADPASASTAAYFGDTSQAPGGTVGIMPYAGARGLVIKNPAASPSTFIELQDSAGAILGRWLNTGIIQAVGPDMYFGPYAFSTGVGVRARINTVLGANPAVGLLAESDATTPDVNTVLRPKGGGTVQLQNSNSQVVVEVGYSGGNRYLGFFAGAPALKQTITGSRGTATATVLGNLLTALATYGLLVNSTTA